MVGAVLVHEGRIIGEGFHERVGDAHAEVNCFRSVKPEDRQWITESTLYVTLEPCAHFGRTPPCAELLIRERVKQVVVAMQDPFEKVSGKGIAMLKGAGIDVTLGICEKKSRALNARFLSFHERHRPWIILKWAQTGDGYMGSGTDDRLMISCKETNVLVHHWRSYEDGILVGARTAIADNPQLTVRLVEGRSPLRFILSNTLELPEDLGLFHDGEPVVVISDQSTGIQQHIKYERWTRQEGSDALMDIFFNLGIQGLMVEGGAGTLTYFMENELWDEIRLISNDNLIVGKGLKSPQLPSNAILVQEEMCGTDRIQYFARRS